MMINLFVNYYKSGSEERQREIDFCLDRNLSNQFIGNLVIFTNDIDKPISEKAIQKSKLVNIDRPTYQDFFKATKDYPNDINIICNSDIYFDDTLEHVKKMGENDFYCLTRWEYNQGNITEFNRMHGAPAEWSQDAWIFKGACRIDNCDKVIAVNQKTGQYEEIPFTGGIPGNDNHLAWLARDAGYNVSNPSKTIKAIHVHQERSRDYGHSYRITGTKTGGQWGRLLKVDQI